MRTYFESPKDFPASGAMPLSYADGGGDVCASLYCNSPAMHGGPIRDLADPKFVAKGWMTRNNAYISLHLQRRYQSAMEDERCTLKLELFLGHYRGYLFPRMGCRFSTASEVRRAVVVMDSLKAQEGTYCLNSSPGDR